MSDSSLAWLITAWAAGLIGAAALHALGAAFEHLPLAEERRLAERRRPDGRRTLAAWLARDSQATANSGAVAYSIAEAGALVVFGFLAADMSRRIGGSWAWTLLVSAAIAATLSLVVVRAIPRNLARARPLTTIRVVAPVAALLIAATAPVRALAPALRRRAPAEPGDLVDRAGESLEEEDVELLRSVVELGDTIVREVMVPRIDMVTIQSGTDAGHAMGLFLSSGRSRLPVVGEGVDDLVGVLYLKDLLVATWGHKDALARPVDECAREPFFVPESIKVDALLRTMQRDAIHMAVVVDEFGGVAGLVTIEDALEEIVGELIDEHDVVAPEPVALADGSYRVPARMSLDELGELFDIDIDDDDVETTAGLLAKALGRVPIAGASVTTHGLRLVAAGTQGRRKRLAWIVATRIEREVSA